MRDNPINKAKNPAEEETRRINPDHIFEEVLFEDEEITTEAIVSSRPAQTIRPRRMPDPGSFERPDKEPEHPLEDVPALADIPVDDAATGGIRSPKLPFFDPAAAEHAVKPEQTEPITSAKQAGSAEPAEPAEQTETKPVEAPIRAAKPPRAQIVRPTHQSNPLAGSEIKAKDKEIITPLPRVDEFLPKRAPVPAVETESATKADVSRKAPVSKMKPQKVKKKRVAATNKKRFSARQFMSQRQAGLLLMISALLEIVLLMGWMSLPDGIFGLDKNGFSGHILATALTQLILVLLPSLFIVSVFRQPVKEITGEGKTGFALGLLSFIIGIPAGLSLHALNNILMVALTRMDILVPEPTLPGLVMPDSPRALPLLLIVTVLAPAVFEELMFRGIILPRMAKSSHTGISLALSAIAFALFHDDPLFWLAPLGAGFILGFLRLKSDNLFTSILAHMSMNLSILFISPLIPQFSSRLVLSLGRNSNSFFYANLIIAMVMAALMIPLFIRFNTMSAPPSDLFGEDGQIVTPPARQRVFFINKKQKPGDFSSLPDKQSRVNPFLDVFFWLACLILLAYLLSAYFIRL